MVVMGEAGNARAYAIGLLTGVVLGPGIQEYLERIDSTLTPHQGRFLVHGGAVNILEGPAVGDVVIIEFPTIDAATDWYFSDAYQAILSLRTDNANGTVLLVKGVEADHVATDVLSGRTPRSADG